MTTSKTALAAVVAASLGLASCETGPTNEDIGFRVGTDGLPPYELDNVLGRRIREALYSDDVIVFENLLEK